ncbi:MAG TPA: hypothetical protein VGZ22_09900 [Isosphaeraceae bacterium]|nr:hypothetical protein [Isosphaeraceae bacterium]
MNQSEAEGTRRDRRAGWWGGPTLALVAGLLIWLWPIGCGGKMPLGGDVTQFSIGLMSFLQHSLRAGRLPLWNDLWGFGFPGLAESQMGVFYPPHWVLYSALPLEWAYTLNLVLHTLWGGLGASWAARRFGVSPWGAALAGFAWAASGFYLIHLPHHWAATTGAWMPWAWGLGWTLLSGSGCGRTVRNLALVLALQILPGHFQLAFCTQVGLLAMALWALVERPAGGPRTLRLVGLLLLAMLAIVPLDAMQLWPTLRLAQQAASRRDFEYLSGFAVSPLHLVNYVAPGLFHRSPLWRPVAWDPFHTSPEEHLAYIGLVPLFLAVGAIVHGLKRDAAVRALLVIAVLTLILSFGPYLPGFAIWSRWPGFSFFRAPARWGLATELALALLAGKGFDAIALSLWPRPGRALLRFVAAAVAAVGMVVLTFELALASTESPGWPAVANSFDRAQRLLPWSEDPSFRPFRQVMVTARRPQDDSARVPAGQAREGFPIRANAPPRLSEDRFEIYVKEWGETAAVLVGLLALSALARRPKVFAAGLLALTAIDLWCLGQHRTIDLGPIRALTAQSPTLARMAAEPRGTRMLGEQGNLPMVAGCDTVAAFRTLDLPALEALTALARGSLARPEADRRVLAALRATGTGLRLYGPYEDHTATRNSLQALGESPPEAINDPTLAGWMFGADLVKTPSGARATRFLLWRAASLPARAWFVPEARGRSLADLAANNGDPNRVLNVMQASRPLRLLAPDPEHLAVEIQADQPGLVLLSQLADPGWRAAWVNGQGSQAAEIVRVFGGWQAVKLPGEGSWTLWLAYPGHDVWLGITISAVAWTLGAMACWWSWLRRRKVREGNPP